MPNAKTYDEMIREIEAAGWTPEQEGCWDGPNGEFAIGVSDAYDQMMWARETPAPKADS